MSEIENIPVEFNGKVVGRASIDLYDKIEITFTNLDIRSAAKQILELGLVRGITLDFLYIPAVERTIQK
jgi:hypothetical protein